MNVELKKWTIENTKELMKICNEADRTYLSGRIPDPYTEKDAKEWIGMVQEHEGKDGIFRAIVADGEIVGNISVEQKSDVFCKDSEIGFLLLSEYQSKGIMTKAVELICAEAFSALSIVRITANVFRPNMASRSVLEKNGFLVEGVLKRAVYKNDDLYDVCIYGKYK